LLWTALHDRQARWGFWFLGSLAGAVPLLPWAQYMLFRPGGQGMGSLNPLWILCPSYWFYWVGDALGLALKFTLRTQQYMDFLGYPRIGGVGTYLVAVLHLAIIIAGILILVSMAKHKRISWGFRDKTETGLALHSALYAAGALLTLSCIELWRHYLIVTFPMEWVWLSRLGLGDARRGRKLLAVIWAAQLLISAAFLVYIHLNHGAGRYGTTYQYYITPH
jgi:hypothetical protein